MDARGREERSNVRVNQSLPRRLARERLPSPFPWRLKGACTLSSVLCSTCSFFTVFTCLKILVLYESSRLGTLHKSTWRWQKRQSGGIGADVASEDYYKARFAR